MKGLLIKDFCLLKNQKNFFLMILVLGIIMMLTGMEAIYIISFSVFVLSMFVASSLTYDEYDNGYPFLFSLPITRKSYVVEKYVFALIMCVGSWILTTAATTIFQLVNGVDLDLKAWLLSCLMFLVAVLYLNAITIPSQLKFGGEKGRVVLFAIIGFTSFLVFLVLQGVKYIGIDGAKVINEINSIGIYPILGVIAASSIIVLYISYLCSKKIISNKQF